MNKSMLTGAIIGGAAVISLGSVAGYQALKGPSYAQVMQVAEVKETVKTPEQVCKQVQITHRKPVKDENRIAGTLIGGLVGGALGNQVGGGNGKKIATVAGAVGGGYAGNQIQKNMQQKDSYTTSEQRCKTVTRSHDRVVGYDVQYKLGDKVDTVRMSQPPTSDRIPVEHGQLVLATAPVAVTPAVVPAN